MRAERAAAAHETSPPKRRRIAAATTPTDLPVSSACDIEVTFARPTAATTLAVPARGVMRGVLLPRMVPALEFLTVLLAARAWAAYIRQALHERVQGAVRTDSAAAMGAALTWRSPAPL